MYSAQKELEQLKQVYQQQEIPHGIKNEMIKRYSLEEQRFNQRVKRKKQVKGLILSFVIIAMMFSSIFFNNQIRSFAEDLPLIGPVVKLILGKTLSDETIEIRVPQISIKDKENILLSEMGSGSNWLAIHLSTFLGFLYLHSITSTSKIPSILILDQPSQVYFPKVYKQLDEEVENEQTKVDDNIIQVKNIFKVISDEIANIDVECGYKPQVIVLEHADEDEFAQFIKYRWSKDGNKLI